MILAAALDVTALTTEGKTKGSTVVAIANVIQPGLVFAAS